jgi:extracellular elastinolytic metalloproteinase
VTTPDGVDSIGGFSFTKNTLIFPNPAIGFVTVNLSNTTTATQIILTDLSGRLVRTVNISPNISQASVNLAGLIPGVYLLMWRDGITAKKQLLMVR